MTKPGMLYCAGYGYTAEALSRLLLPEGWKVTGTTRSAEKAGRMKKQNIVPAVWNGEGLLPSISPDYSPVMLVSLPPRDTGCPVLAAVERSPDFRPAQVAYLSSNAVYGDYGGEEVTEDSPLRSSSARGRRRILAEKSWKDFGASHGMPVTVFRLPGIYGPGRSAIDAVRDGKAKRIEKKGQVFSRMHVDDIALVLKAAIASPCIHDTYNLADDEPASSRAVVEYACALLDAPMPPLTNVAQAGLSETGKSFYRDNKRVLNGRMKQDFGIRLRYPTYREGLQAVLQMSGRHDGS